MFTQLTLNRIPKDDELQAWNAADELFLNRANDKAQSLLMVNDSFGALTTALARKDIHFWSDSATSYEALSINAHSNRVPIPVLLNNASQLGVYQSIALTLPKSARYFEFLLTTLSKHLESNGVLYVLAMTKYVGKQHITAMNNVFESVNPGQAVKKARVIELARPKTKHSPVRPTNYFVDTLQTSLTNLPGCYAESQVDTGALVFIDHFKRLPRAKNIIDLGCGNGILTLALLNHMQPERISLIDDSNQAIESARKNLASCESMATFNFFHSNGFNQVPVDVYADLIVCNPPFHQQNLVTEKIAQQMIEQSATRLSKGGEFWLVANRHLPYWRLLKLHFAQVDTLSKHPKFTVYRCSL